MATQTMELVLSQNNNLQKTLVQQTTQVNKIIVVSHKSKQN